MPALFFPTPDALRLALASGLVPASISREPARAGFDPQGHLWLEPAEPLARESLTALARLGVRVLGGAGLPMRSARSWAELLPLRRATTPHQPGVVLFDVPDRLLPGFVARLRRSCGAAVGVRLLDEPHAGRAWVTVDTPPPSLTLWADEPQSEVRAYGRQTPGVWAACGWEHPLASYLAVPPDSVLLCRPEWEVACVGGPVPEPVAEEHALPRASLSPPWSQPLVGVPVRLRLVASAASRDETFWVLPPEEREAFDEFCRAADERLLRRFQVATVGAGGEARLVVRRAAEDDGTAVLPLSTAGFQPDPRSRSLFVPAGFALRPAIRADALARALPLEPGRLVWVEPTEGGVAVHAIPVAAFRPLRERVEYVAPERASLAADRTPEETFSLARFALLPESPVVDLADEPDERADEPEAMPSDAGEDPSWVAQSVARVLRWVRGRSRPASCDDRAPARPPSKPPRPAGRAQTRGERVERKLASPDALLHGHDRAARRHDLEGRLLADFPRLGPDQRAARWAELAGVYSATGRALDAAVCWLNAIWECTAPPEGWLEQWAAAECRAAKGGDRGADLERWLGEPGRPGTGRVVAALAAYFGFRPSPPPEFLAALPRVLAVLDQQFDDIPLRGAWLARAAVARSCDGDTLGLARWRDRLVARMHERGPGLDLDEPSFLRFRGTATAERFQTARDWLTRVHQPVLDWVKRHAGAGGLQWAGLDGEGDATAAYAQFLLAWGLGALGERTRSRDWAARARKSLSRAAGAHADPAGHALLGDLLLHRIKDAHEGRVPKPGLPAELRERYEKLPELARYSVDRLRDHCRILEPFGPVRAFQGRDVKVFWGTDRLGERLSVLGRTDPSRLGEEGRGLLALAAAEPSTTTVPRITFGLLVVAPFLEASVLSPLLELVPTALEWLEAWLQAGRWTEDERDRRLTQFQTAMIESAFAAAPPADAERLLRHLARAAATGPLLPAVVAAAPRVFRAARKCGLSTEAEALMRVLDPARGEWEGTRPVPAERIGLAIGWYAAGDAEAGNRILDAARGSLFPTTADDPPARTPLADDPRARTPVALAYAEALGFAPTRIALGRLEEIFQRLGRVSVDGSTNRYFTLQPLRLVDTVVRSVVTDEFTLGATVRAWLDEDEFLIRRRIHREMAALLREQDGG